MGVTQGNYTNVRTLEGGGCLLEGAVFLGPYCTINDWDLSMCTVNQIGAAQSSAYYILHPWNTESCLVAINSHIYLPT